MIEGLSVTDPKYRLVVLQVDARLEVLRDNLEKASDPTDIHRLQGGIRELKNLIAPPDTV